MYALSKYAIQGVQFTYLRLGNVEQYSNTTADGSQLKVVYEIPTALADILKLSEADATVMTGDGISTPCDNTGVLHYTSTQINDALDAILKADDVAAKNALESYLLDYATQSTDGDDKQAADTGVLETDANGLASKDKLALGLYLMVETKVPEQVTSTVNVSQSDYVFSLVKEALLEFVLLDTVIYSIISNIRDTKKNHKQQNMRRYYVPFKYDLEFVLSAITMHNLKDKEMYARIKFSVDINKILKEKKQNDVSEIDKLLAEISTNYYKTEILEQKTKVVLSRIIDLIE